MGYFRGLLQANINKGYFRGLLQANNNKGYFRDLLQANINKGYSGVSYKLILTRDIQGSVTS